jgi:hypothetical protein
MRHHQPTATERKKSLSGIVRARGRVLRKVVGDVINARGRAREEQVLSALSTMTTVSLPSWFSHTEQACQKDDARGVDVVVHTDVGKLFLQIKGSQKAIDEFVRKHTKGNIVPFLVQSDECIESLQKRLIEALSNERARILSLRNR